MTHPTSHLVPTQARILVTGGAGFIGSWLIRELFSQFPNCHITNLDALTYAGNLANLSDIDTHPNYTFVKGDIRDGDLVDQLMAKTDICIHAAAQTHVDRSINSPAIFTDTNVMGTQTLLEAGRQHGIQRFVHISTDEVYGSIETGEFTENSPLDPNSPYAASKASADLLTQSYHRTYGFPTLITRCSNNYGPYQYPEKLIPLMIHKALADENLPVYGDGLNVRDWIHVQDHAKAVITILQHAQPGAIVNIGTQNEQTNIGIVKTLLSLLGKSESLISYVTDRPGHDRRYAINPQLLKNQLGWSPTIEFEQGLIDTVSWYQQNTQWVADLAQRAEDDAEQFEQGVHSQPALTAEVPHGV
jgi:dTDP-glucose 4,6-dehydratase